MSAEPVPMRPARDAWLISGIPGSGKTTIARKLAARLPRAAHIEGDRLQEWIVSGAVYPGECPKREATRQLALCRHNQCLLAASYAEAGFVPVIDFVIVSQRQLDEYRAHLPKLALHLVVLTPGAETALSRDSLRAEKQVAAHWTHLEMEIARELSGDGLWIDNSAMTIPETVDLIVQLSNDARI